MKALLSPAYAKLSNVPPVTDEASAEKLLNEMIPSMFYLRVERGDHLPPPPGPSGSSPSSSPGKQPRVLRIAQAQRYKQDEYFVWFLPASQLKTTLGAIGLVVAVLGGCMFPLWPIKLRIGVWYLSVGVLGLLAALVVIAIFRLIFWGLTKFTVKPGIWIFPRLFDDLGVVSFQNAAAAGLASKALMLSGSQIESFQPLWAWDVPPAPKKHKKRSKKEEGAQPAAPPTESKGTLKNGEKTATPKGTSRIEEIHED